MLAWCVALHGPDEQQTIFPMQMPPERLFMLHSCHVYLGEEQGKKCHILGGNAQVQWGKVHAAHNTPCLRSRDLSAAPLWAKLKPFLWCYTAIWLCCLSIGYAESGQCNLLQLPTACGGALREAYAVSYVPFFFRRLLLCKWAHKTGRPGSLSKNLLSCRGWSSGHLVINIEFGEWSMRRI